MSKPMTTQRVVQLYECNDCKAGNFCNHDCVESGTCSITCIRCKGKLWFNGSLERIPKLFKCPYCESTLAYDIGDKYATRNNYKNNNGSGID